MLLNNSRAPLLLVSSASASIVFLAVGFSVEPFWVLAAFAATPLVFLAMRKWPAIFIPPLLFVGQFRSQASVGVSLSDPMVLALLALYGTVFLTVLFMLTDQENSSLADCFSGQGAGVAAFCLLTGMIGLSYLYTPAHAYGWQKLTRFVVISGILFFSPFMLLRREKDLRHFVTIMLWLSMILVVKTVTGVAQGTSASATGTSGDIRDLRDVTRIVAGQLMGVTLLIVLFSNLFLHRSSRWLSMLCIPCLVGGVIAATARGPVVALIFVLLLSAFFPALRQHFLSGRMLWLLLLVLATALASYSWLQQSAARRKLQSKEAEIVEIIQGSSHPTYDTGERLRFYKSALLAFAQKPFTGWGLGGWSVYYHRYDKRGYPHNLLLEIAAEQGILGVIAVATLFGTLVLCLATIWRRGRQFLFLLPVLVFSFTVTMFSGDLNDNRALWLWCGMAFAVCRLVSFQRETQRQRSPGLFPVTPPFEFGRALRT